MRLKYIVAASLAVVMATGVLAPLRGVSAEGFNGAKGMDRIQTTERNRQQYLGDARTPLAQTDPELAAMRERLVYGEIVERGTLDARQRALITLVVFQMLGGITDFYRSWRGVRAATEFALLLQNWTLSVIFSAGLVAFNNDFDTQLKMLQGLLTQILQIIQ